MCPVPPKPCAVGLFADVLPLEQKEEGLAGLSMKQVSAFIACAEKDPQSLAMKLLRHLYRGPATKSTDEPGSGGEDSSSSDGDTEVDEDIIDAALVNLSRVDVSTLLVDMNLDQYITE
mmetsp:Transcript_98850/g.284023  ORF Transcript_98850/g.284023 Transcript_98850/m.284023 type:complete len:118 (+) Transcript_98850:93-446(+)